MAFLSMSYILAFSILAHQAFSLQVSPGSPCASACLDTDSTTPATLGSEISCLDSDYSDTPMGRKFMSCVSCLQTSAYSSDSFDQEWFLYNLRYTLDSCLFGFTNATDAITTPCSTADSCGPLQQALESGNLNPTNETAYSYCQADSNAFLGSSLPKCISCLQDTSNEKYLANFMIALQAGCEEPVPAGTLIGIQGSVFSAEPVNITYPGYNQTAATTIKPSSNKGLPQGAIIGIAVGLGCLLIIAIATLFVCYRKRENAKKMKGLASPLDSRFGATNITAPTDGAYGNPYSGPSVAVAQTFNPRNFSKKELAVLDNARSVLSRNQSNPGDMKDPEEWQDLQAQLGAPPQYSGTTIPTHQAYIPTHGPVSPTGSTATSHTYISTPSSRSSPRDPPPGTTSPPFRVTPTTSPQFRPTNVTTSLPSRPSPANSPPFRTTPANSPPVRGLTPANSPPVRGPTPANSPPFRGPTPVSSNYQASPPYSGSSRRNIPPPIAVPSAMQPSPREIQLTEIQMPSEQSSLLWPPSRFSPPAAHLQPQYVESSRISPSGLHSKPNSPPLETRPPSRTASRAENILRRATSRAGVGNVNANNEAPVQISGPLVRHAGRFDFELAERERREKDAREGIIQHAKILRDETPVSAESPEQWPGSY